jgi:hypothetical protein
MTSTVPDGHYGDPMKEGGALAAADRPVPPPGRVPSPRVRRSTASVPLDVAARLGASELDRLCERIRGMLDAAPREVLVCGKGVAAPDLGTVDTVARVQLAARRSGSRVLLCHASPELIALLDLAGLLPAELPGAGSGVEPRRKAEEREEAGGVQEERDPADPTA